MTLVSAGPPRSTVPTQTPGFAAVRLKCCRLLIALKGLPHPLKYSCQSYVGTKTFPLVADKLGDIDAMLCGGFDTVAELVE